MPVTHPNIRTWLQTKLGYGLQASEGSPLATVPKWLWADVLAMGKGQRFLEWNGAFGLAHKPREGIVPTFSLPVARFRLAATFNSLTNLLPWATQAAIGSWGLGLANYFTFAKRDHPSGRDLRVVDALPQEFRLESSVATAGILLVSATAIGQDFKDEAAGAVTYTESTPSDKKRFLHNAATVTRTDTSEPIGVSRVSLNLVTGVFPWEHDDPFALLRKDGPLNVEGELESAFSDKTDALRRLTDQGSFVPLEFKWTSEDSPAKVLTVLLSDVILSEENPETGISDKRFAPFRARFKNYGTPTLTLA